MKSQISEVSVLDVLREELSSLEISLLLAGSFSRGEETYTVDSGEKIFLSDIEFMLFVSFKDWVFKKRRQQISNQVKGVCEQYKLKCDIAVKPVVAIGLIPKTWLWYETVSTRVLLVDYYDLYEELGDLFKIDALDIGDVNETFFHSCFAVYEVLVSSRVNNKDVTYTILKRSLDLLIPVSVKSGGGVISHGARIRFFQTLIERDDLYVPQSLSLFMFAMCNVKNNEHTYKSIDTDWNIGELTKCYLQFLDICFKYVFDANIESYLNIVEFGERSFRRKSYLLQKVLQKPSSNMWILSKEAPFRLFCEVYHLLVELSDTVGDCGFHDITGVEISKFVKVKDKAMLIHRSIK